MLSIGFLCPPRRPGRSRSRGRFEGSEWLQCCPARQPGLWRRRRRAPARWSSDEFFYDGRPRGAVPAGKRSGSGVQPSAQASQADEEAGCEGPRALSDPERWQLRPMGRGARGVLQKSSEWLAPQAPEEVGCEGQGQVKRSQLRPMGRGVRKSSVAMRLAPVAHHASHLSFTYRSPIVHLSFTYRSPVVHLSPQQLCVQTVGKFFCELLKAITPIQQVLRSRQIR